MEFAADVPKLVYFPPILQPNAFLPSSISRWLLSEKLFWAQGFCWGI